MVGRPESNNKNNNNNTERVSGLKVLIDYSKKSLLLAFFIFFCIIFSLMYFVDIYTLRLYKLNKKNNDNLDLGQETFDLDKDDCNRYRTAQVNYNVYNIQHE